MAGAKQLAGVVCQVWSEPERQARDDVTHSLALGLGRNYQHPTPGEWGLAFHAS